MGRHIPSHRRCPANPRLEAALPYGWGGVVDAEKSIDTILFEPPYLTLVGRNDRGRPLRRERLNGRYDHGRAKQRRIRSIHEERSLFHHIGMVKTIARSRSFGSVAACTAGAMAAMWFYAEGKYSTL